MYIKNLKKGYLFKCDACDKEFIGRPGRKYCNGSCANSVRTGENNPHWKGGLPPKYKKKSITKGRAARLVFFAVKAQELIPQPCEICGSSSQFTQAHHQDYSKPYDVNWLCPSCHGKIGFAVRELKELAHACA